MRSRRLRGAGWTAMVTVVAGLALTGAGIGVLRFMDYSEKYDNGASDASVIGEQIQILAVVAAQAAVPGSDLGTVGSSGREAGLKVAATLKRLSRSGLQAADVRLLDRKLNQYLASLALIDRLFTGGEVDQARIASAATAALVGPIAESARTMQNDLRRSADKTNQLARRGSLALLIMAVATIAGLTIVVERRHRRDAVDAADYAARARFEAMAEHSVDVITVMDESRLISYVSPALRTTLGYEPEEWINTRQSNLVHPDDRPFIDAAFDRVVADGHPTTLDFRVLHADRSWRTLEADVALLTTDIGVSILWTARDVTAKRDMEDQLQRQAFEDALTGLPNRAVLRDRLTQAMARASRSGAEIAVLLLDLDNFKEINDSFGHSAGDAALVTAAATLTAAVRVGDTVARLGGDEFVVVAEGLDARAVAHELAERIHAAMPAAVPVVDSAIRLSASIGAVVVDHSGVADEIVRNADIAMYHAKTLGRGRTVFFEGSMLAAAQTKLELGLELNHALERGQFQLHYQPLVDLNTGNVVGAEALLRWNHPERGLVSPGVFIPLAERTDAILSIGAWVLGEACRQAMVWSAELPVPFASMHVNVSARQLTNADEFVTMVAGTLQDTGMNPAMLVLELTESALLADSAEAVKCLHKLKSLGVRIAIDDFGTGYSSLSRLAHLPIDVLKIDQSFVQAAGATGGNERVLLTSILGMTQRLGLEPIAEGIERPRDLDSMRNAGCRLGQGFLLGYPVPAAEFGAVVVPAG